MNLSIIAPEIQKNTWDKAVMFPGAAFSLEHVDNFIYTQMRVR